MTRQILKLIAKPQNPRIPSVHAASTASLTLQLNNVLELGTHALQQCCCAFAAHSPCAVHHDPATCQGIGIGLQPAWQLAEVPQPGVQQFCTFLQV